MREGEREREKFYFLKLIISKLLKYPLILLEINGIERKGPK